VNPSEERGGENCDRWAAARCGCEWVFGRFCLGVYWALDSVRFLRETVRRWEAVGWVRDMGDSPPVLDCERRKRLCPSFVSGAAGLSRRMGRCSAMMDVLGRMTQYRLVHERWTFASWPSSGKTLCRCARVNKVAVQRHTGRAGIPLPCTCRRQLPPTCPNGPGRRGPGATRKSSDRASQPLLHPTTPACPCRSSDASCSCLGTAV
jgi:hypothetical protein